MPPPLTPVMIIFIIAFSELWIAPQPELFFSFLNIVNAKIDQILGKW